MGERTLEDSRGIFNLQSFSRVRIRTEETRGVRGEFEPRGGCELREAGVLREVG